VQRIIKSIIFWLALVILAAMPASALVYGSGGGIGYAGTPVSTADGQKPIEKESLYSDPLVQTEIYPTPGKVDAQIFESELIDEVDAPNNPEYYNKQRGNQNAGQ
jgi:hypothetical protein